MGVFSKFYPKAEEHEGAVPIEIEASIVVNQSELEATIGTESFWGITGRWCVYLVALLAPLWFLPVGANPVDENKLFFVSLLTLVGFIIWLGVSIQDGTIKFPRNAALYALGMWLVVYVLAAIFSVSPESSVWGSSTTSVFHILIGGLLAFTAASVFRTARDIHRAYTLILIGAAIAVLFLMVQTMLGIDVFQWEFAKQRTFHPIGSWNIVGIFLGFVFTSMFPFFINNTNVSRFWRYFLIALSVLVLLGAVMVNYRMVWLGMAVMSVVYLAYSYSRSTEYQARTASMVGPLLFLFISVVLFLSQDVVSVYTASFNPPLDVTPSVSSSWQVAQKVFQERPILGVGPDEFGYAWDRFKDPLVNATIYWRLRFATASSFATTLLTTTGVLGGLVFLLFIGSILWVGFLALSKLQPENQEHQFISATFFGLFFLLFSWFVYPLTATIAMLTFLVFGLFIAQVSMSGLASYHTFSIRADSTKGFLAALIIVFLMVFSVVGLYIRSRKQVAALEYGRGISALLERNSVNEAENFFRRAVVFNASRDEYYSAIVQTSAIKLQRVLQNTKGKSPEEVRDSFQVALSSAITSAQTATEVSPGNAANWQLLGQVYELVIPYVGGAGEAAAEAYRHAITQSPQDPVLYDDLARVSMVLGDYVKAREALGEAIRLKPDYAAAHFRLAQIAIVKGNVGEAISNTERAALSAPNDIGILFQLGLLYYQQSRYDEARQILLRAVQLNTNYSNARYFLGLAYAAKGDHAHAIEQFEFIQALNPANQEVTAILNNLKAGKDPLADISPPPLNRDKVPVAKEGGELQQQGTLDGRSSQDEARENAAAKKSRSQ